MSPASRDPELPHDSIRLALEAVRRHLGMEVAYVSEFVGERAVFREVDAPGLGHLIKSGDSQALKDVYCEHILAGRLPELMPDTADFPLAASLPITAAVPIGAHVSVPIRLPDGEPYGMFCCLSPTPNASLNQRDLDVMRAFAELAGHQINAMRERDRTLRTTQQQIEAVIAGTAFSFHYQPIVRFDPWDVIGYEALCRFLPQPYRSPDQWFDQAFRVGHGIDLELAVLDMAVTALDRLPAHQYITLNASPATILAGGLMALLRDYPLDRIVLEVTEHAAVADYQALRSALAPLRQSGARLAIDDAGAGFASLQHIIHLAPDIIKLDRSLTQSIEADPARRALAAALSYFAQETQSQIVAEGIETEAELATLQSLGILTGQGYLLGRPAPLPTVIAAPIPPFRAAVPVLDRPVPGSMIGAGALA